jgi:DMSO/TMAO reductase YedYZ molybdopterin-dependent catalytic subunit
MEKRRQFLRKIFGFVAGVSLSLTPAFSLLKAALAKSARTILPKGTKRETLVNQNPADLDATHLEVTPLQDFGTMGLSDHAENLGKWRLQVIGHVENPLGLKYDEILAMPAIERSVLLICPGFFANHGRWKGISIRTILEMAHAKKDATHVSVYGPEGDHQNSQRYPMQDIQSDKVFLAYEVNGKPLPQRHGFPLRAVAEDHFGYDWVKYVYKVEVNKI